jgi:adenylate kinase family enzyme
MPESILFIQGKPGAGKSTASRHAVMCQDTWTGGLTARHLSVGERFRGILNGDYPSRYATAVREATVSVADRETPASLALPNYLLVHRIVQEYLEENRSEPGITLIDGYPKDIELVPLIAKQQTKGQIEIKGIIELDTSDEEAVVRQLGRSGLHSAHPVYSEAVAYSRVKHHTANVRPVIDELSRLGDAFALNGDQPLEDLHNEFILLIGELCKK